tara:strand:- start:2524 stop:5880 length:3357 start_codon:yes stop_codon:yes gene_type:complete
MAISKEQLIIELKAAGVNLTTAQLKKLGKQTDKTSGSLKNMALAAGGIMAVSAAFRNVMSAGMDFTSQLSNLRAITDATDKDMKVLEKSAKELGKTTKFTAGEVVSLQTEFGKLGFSTREIQGAQKATLELAASVNTDLSTAATIAGQTVNQFRLTAEDTQRVVDVMAASFSSSALDLEKFTNAMTYVGPLAGDMGISIEGTTGLIAKLADVGIDGSIAGTALRRVFLEMGNESSKLAKRVGFAVKSEEDMFKALKQLNAEGITTTEMTELVGKRAVTAFTAMVDLADGAETLSAALEDAGGTAERMAEQQLDNLSGDLVKLKSASEAVYLEIYEGLEPVFRLLAQSATAFLRSIDSEEVQAYGTALLLVAGGFTAVKIQAALATSGLVAFKTALITTGVGALVVGLGALLDYMNVFEDSTDTFAETSKAKEYETEATKKLTEAERELANIVNQVNDAYDTGAFENVIERLEAQKLKIQSDLDWLHAAGKGFDEQFESIFSGGFSQREMETTAYDNFLIPDEFKELRSDDVFLFKDLDEVEGEAAAYLRQLREIRAMENKILDVMQDDYTAATKNIGMQENAIAVLDEELAEYEAYIQRKIDAGLKEDTAKMLANAMFPLAQTKVAQRDVEKLMLNFFKTQKVGIEQLLLFRQKYGDQWLVEFATQTRANEDTLEQIDAEIEIVKQKQVIFEDANESQKKLNSSYKEYNRQASEKITKDAVSIAQTLSAEAGLAKIEKATYDNIHADLEAGYSIEFVTNKYKEQLGVVRDYTKALEEIKQKQSTSQTTSIENALLESQAQGTLAESLTINKELIQEIADLVDRGYSLDIALQSKFSNEFKSEARSSALTDIITEGIAQEVSLEGQVSASLENANVKELDIKKYGWELRLLSKEEFLVKELDAEFNLLKTSEEFEALSAEEKLKINENYHEKKKQLAHAAAVAESGYTVMSVKSIANSLAALGEVSGAHAKDILNLKIITAVADTFAGMQQALAAYPPPFGAIAAAGVFLQGTANVKAMKKQHEEAMTAQTSTAQPALNQPTIALATGGTFTTNGPQNILVGDNPGGSELVSVRPIGSREGGSNMSGVTINISGNVMTEDFVENELREKIQDLVRRGGI